MFPILTDCSLPVRKTKASCRICFLFFIFLVNFGTRLGMLTGPSAFQSANSPVTVSSPYQLMRQSVGEVVRSGCVAAGGSELALVITGDALLVSDDLLNFPHVVNISSSVETVPFLSLMVFFSQRQQCATYQAPEIASSMFELVFLRLKKIYSEFCFMTENYIVLFIFGWWLWWWPVDSSQLLRSADSCLPFSKRIPVTSRGDFVHQTSELFSLTFSQTPLESSVGYYLSSGSKSFDTLHWNGNGLTASDSAMNIYAVFLH